MLTMPQVDVPVFNHFFPGLYGREIRLKKGTTLTGRMHKYENLNILSKGSMLLYTENGPVQVNAPYIVVSPPGTKRTAHCLTDCVWITFHFTDETDVDVIQEQFTVLNEQEYLQFRANLQLGE